MTRRAPIAAGGIVVVALAALALFVLAPPLSPVGQTACLTGSDAACLRFPSIAGQALSGAALTLPDGAAAAHTLIVVPFDEDQQIAAGAWLPLAQRLQAAHPDFGYYSVAVFPEIAPPIRLLIIAGMQAAVTDAALEARTLTVFLEDRDAFLAALSIPDVGQLQVFLLNARGEVVWRAAGIPGETSQAALEALLDA